ETQYGLYDPRYIGGDGRRAAVLSMSSPVHRARWGVSRHHEPRKEATMDLDLTTTITGVTVYPDRAQVTRAGATRLDAPGEHTLRIGGLPLALLSDSVRASGTGPPGTRILAVEQAHEAKPSAPDEALQALQAEIERLEREIALLDERLRSVDERKEWLRTLGDQAARSLAWGIARGSTKPEDASGLFAYADEQAQYLATSRQEVQTARN